MEKKYFENQIRGIFELKMKNTTYTITIKIQKKNFLQRILIKKLYSSSSSLPRPLSTWKKSPNPSISFNSVPSSTVFVNWLLRIKSASWSWKCSKSFETTPQDLNDDRIISSSNSYHILLIHSIYTAYPRDRKFPAFVYDLGEFISQSEQSFW